MSGRVIVSWPRCPGNPLALLELPRGPGRPCGAPRAGSRCRMLPALSGRIEQSFRERLAPLSPATAAVAARCCGSARWGIRCWCWWAAARARHRAGRGRACRLPLAWSISGGRCGSVTRSCVRLNYSAGGAAGAPARSPRAGRGDRCRCPILIAAPGTLRTRRAGLDEDIAAKLERSAGPSAGARRRGGGRRVSRACRRADAPIRRRRASVHSSPQEASTRPAQNDAGGAAAGGSRRPWTTGPIPSEPGAQLLRAQITFATTRSRDAPPLLLEAAKRLEAACTRPSRARRPSRRSRLPSRRKELGPGGRCA